MNDTVRQNNAVARLRERADRDEKIVREYEDGLSVEKLARRYQMTVRQVYRILGGNGAQLRGWS